MDRLKTVIINGIILATTLAGHAAPATRGELAQERAAQLANAEWFDLMDTGPFISDTFLAPGSKGGVAVLKGIAIKVGAAEDRTVVFDTELMRMVGGFEGRVKLGGTPWNGKHADNSYLPAERAAYFFLNERTPGWSIDGNWHDRRLDGYGPLPREMAKYHGLYRHGGDVLIEYTVDQTLVRESPRFADGGLVRYFKTGATHRQLQVLVADPFPEDQGKGQWRQISHHLIGGAEGMRLETLESGRVVVTLPAGTEATEFQVVYNDQTAVGLTPAPIDWAAFAVGGPAIYPETIITKGIIGPDQRPYALDTIPYPSENPWFANTRFGAFDFFDDGDRVACSTWNGDVWVASGMQGDLQSIRWQRFASGLYQTLGLKIIDGVVYTQGRDQITRLHDLNGDGEADFYENFNNDIKITAGFHEFSFDLVTDQEGNLWFSKAMPVQSGGRGFSPWTEHNGAVLKISPDGETLERYAWGLRAPGGIGVGPNGEITTGENEGSWVPRCKITWSKPGSFHGVVPSVWDGREFVELLPGSPTDYEKPLVWMPYDVDNSSGSQLWVPEDSEWGPLHRGEMLHFSYGRSSVFRVMRDEVNGQVQGAVYKLPIDLSIPAQRGRFHPKSGDLYVMGLRGWQTNGGTGFQRVRYLGEAEPTPIGLKAYANGILIEFSGALDNTTVEDVRRYAVKKWNYVWGPQYGSGRFSIDHRDLDLEQRAWSEPSKGVVNNVDQVSVRAATLLNDGKTVFLYVPHMTAAMQMEIQMDLATSNGAEVRTTVWNTIHNLRPAFADHGLDLNNLPEIPSAPIGEPGVTMTMAYSAESDKTVLDRVALSVPDQTTLSPFMRSKRPFEAILEATLAMDQRDEIAFKIEGEGEAVLQIGGKVVAEGLLPIESPVMSLETGGHALYAHLASGEASTGRLKLLWRGKDYVWEPVPAARLLHSPDSSLDRGHAVRQGRELFATLRCIECHAPDKPLDARVAMPELLETIPDLNESGDRFEEAWLYDWVREPKGGCPQVITAGANDVVAYLAQQRSGHAAETVAGDAAAGEALMEKLHLTPWVKPLIQEAKHTPAGLKSFLAHPTSHHPDTTFPDLRLTDQEAEDLASYILSQRPKSDSAPEGNPLKGESLVAANCLVCHGTEDRSFRSGAADLDTIWATNWYEDGCVSEEWGRVPELDLDAPKRNALVKFQNTGSQYLTHPTPREYAQRTMERLNCMSCHSGDNKLPRIDQAGDKFTVAWLEKLFRGEVGQIHPDQEARMPAFASRAQHLAKGIVAMHGSTMEEPSQATDPALVEIGHELTGVSGYACVACHAVGETPALAAFEGQGPNLQLGAERLRKDYFLRWMHWPQRVIPTTIMPKYTNDKDEALNGTVLDGNPDAQFEAIWQYLQTLRKD